MTESDDLEIQCMKTLCYGVVKEYTLDGPRDPPEEIKKKRYSPVRLLKVAYCKLRGKEIESISWHECSVCHTPHLHISE